MTQPATYGFERIDFASEVAKSIDNVVGTWIDDDAVGLPIHVEALRKVRAVRLAFAMIEALLEASVAQRMPANRYEFGGLELVRRGGSKIVWNEDGMATAIGWAIEAKFVSTDGEMPEGFDLDTAYAVRDFLLELFGSATIKTTPLKELAVDYDELITRERSRRTVQIIDKSATSEDGAA